MTLKEVNVVHAEINVIYADANDSFKKAIISQYIECRGEL